MEFDEYTDIIDSRDVIERIEELTEELYGDDEYHDIMTGNGFRWELSAEEMELHDELYDLKALASDASDYAVDWEYGEPLIRASYFVDYAKQLAEDIGAVDDDSGWPGRHIDWNAAADELSLDYTMVTFRGVDYWVR